MSGSNKVNSEHKMAALVTCNICKKHVNIRSTAQCSVCKKRYEFDCMGYPESTFRLKNTDEKKRWKCKICAKNKTVTDIVEEIAISNVTLRKKQNTSIKPTKAQQTSSTKQQYIDLMSKNTSQNTKANVSTENSFESLSLDEDIDFMFHTLKSNPQLHRSCPNIKIDNSVSIEILEKKVSILAEKLEIAENEISNLLSENCDLKKQLSMYGTQINQLKDICKSTPKKIPQKKKNNSTIKTKLDFSMEPNSPKQTSQPQNNQRDQNILLKKGENVEENSMPLDSPIKQLSRQAEPSTQLKYKKARNIYIIGDEKVRGLAARLIQIKTGKWNDNYKIQGRVQPYASSNEILRNPDSLLRDLADDDIVILSVGKYDTNPYLLFTNICSTLCRISKCKILILDVSENRFLNVNKLNYELKMFTKNFKNCKYIEVNELNVSYTKKLSFLDLIAYKLNIEIDFIEYENSFLNPIIRPQNPLHDHNKNNDTFFRS